MPRIFFPDNVERQPTGELLISMAPERRFAVYAANREHGGTLYTDLWMNEAYLTKAQLDALRGGFHPLDEARCRTDVLEQPVVTIDGKPYRYKLVDGGTAAYFVREPADTTVPLHGSADTHFAGSFHHHHFGVDGVYDNDGAYSNFRRAGPVTVFDEALAYMFSFAQQHRDGGDMVRIWLPEYMDYGGERYPHMIAPTRDLLDVFSQFASGFWEAAHNNGDSRRAKQGREIELMCLKPEGYFL